MALSNERSATSFFTALIVLFFVGSYEMPANRDVFGAMNQLLLLAWMQEIAAAAGVPARVLVPPAGEDPPPPARRPGGPPQRRPDRRGAAD